MFTTAYQRGAFDAVVGHLRGNTKAGTYIYKSIHLPVHLLFRSLSAREDATFLASILSPQRDSYLTESQERIRNSSATERTFPLALSVHPASCLVASGSFPSCPAIASTRAADPGLIGSSCKMPVRDSSFSVVSSRIRVRLRTARSFRAERDPRKVMHGKHLLADLDGDRGVGGGLALRLPRLGLEKHRISSLIGKKSGVWWGVWYGSGHNGPYRRWPSLLRWMLQLFYNGNGAGRN